MAAPLNCAAVAGTLNHLCLRFGRDAWWCRLTTIGRHNVAMKDGNPNRTRLTERSPADLTISDSPLRPADLATVWPTDHVATSRRPNSFNSSHYITANRREKRDNMSSIHPLIRCRYPFAILSALNAFRRTLPASSRSGSVTNSTVRGSLYFTSRSARCASKSSFAIDPAGASTIACT